MKCVNEEIKEMLPQFLDKALDSSGRFRVERHLEICEDCRNELGLLRMMSEETPPDPGEAFWAWMPEKIHNEVQKHHASAKKRRWPDASRILVRVMPPRWAWAAAATAVAAAATFIVLRPSPMEMDKNITPQASDEYIYFEVGSPAPVDVSALDKKGLEALAAWTDREFAAVLDDNIREDSLIHMDKCDGDAALDDALTELNAREMERLSRMLDRRKQEV